MTPGSSRALPSLLTRRGLLLLVGGALLGFAALFPFAYERAMIAADEAPSELSLTYLRLALDERPHDAALRLRVAETARALGHLQEARRALAPLQNEASESGRAARAQMVALERAAWTAVAPESVRTRERALSHYRAALHAVRPAELSDVEREQLARLAGEAGEPDLRADLLRSIALPKAGAVETPLVRARLDHAERALLDAGRALEAARLRMDSAARRLSLEDGLSDATLAIAHARRADRLDEAFLFYQRLRQRFGAAIPVLETGIGIAVERADTKRALALAEELLAKEPDVAARHAEVLRLATWSGQSKRALSEQLWLFQHGAGADMWRDAERNARALSDVRALRTLYEHKRGRPERLGRKDLLQLVAIHEALGEPERAHTLLARALDDRHASDYSLWNLRFTLERASGQLEKAVSTLAAIDARFPRQLARSEQRAGLLLQLGRLDDAVAVLDEATPRNDYVRLTRLARLAWSTSTAGTARRAYRDLSKHARATEADYFQLYSLDVLEGDLPAAIETTERGLARFGSSMSMLELALNAALTAEDAPRLSKLLARTESDAHPFQVDARYVALRVSYRQGLAARALERGELALAERLVSDAGGDLARGLPHARGAGQQRLTDLARAQRSQELTLALAMDDRVALRRLYPAIEGTLTPRERVHVLHRAGDDEQALARALAALDDPALTEDDREALRRDVKALAWHKPRSASVALELTDFGALRLVGGHARASYYETRGRTWGAGVHYIELSADDDAAFRLARTHELVPWASLKKVWDQHEAAVQIGVDLRNGTSPRPFADVSTTLRFGSPELLLSAQLDEVPSDTAALRALGVRDQLGAVVKLPFSDRFYGSASAVGALYSMRDRTLLGGGGTFEGALGMRLGPRDGPLDANVRLAGRAAPRFQRSGLAEELTRAGLMPESAYWLGVGGTLGLGDLDEPPPVGRALAFRVDGSLGWLFPQDSLGFFLQAGAGTSLFGRDLLSLSGRVGNVIGTAPARTVYSVQLSYSHSLWR